MITSSTSSQVINLSLHFRQWVKKKELSKMVMVAGKKVRIQEKVSDIEKTKTYIFQVGGYLSLMGGFLLHLTLGTLYCFGNMNTYMTSYLRTHVKGQVRPIIVTSIHTRVLETLIISGEFAVL